MINYRIIAAWPNWLILPAMGAFWIVLAVLGARLLGAPPAKIEGNGK